MRARVVSGTDGVSALLSTSDTAACDTPAASAMSFCVGRSPTRALRPPSVRVDVLIETSYMYYKRNINSHVQLSARGGAMPVPRRQIVAAIPAAAVAANLPRA